MNRKLSLTIVDIFPVILLPMVFSIFIVSSYEYLLVLYMIITLGLCQLDIDNVDKKHYGNRLYVRKENMTFCLIKSMVLMTGLYVLAWLIQMPLLLFSSCLTLILLYVVVMHQVMTIYETGIKYKGRFYSHEAINKGYLVKNYQSMYEIYIGNQKITVNSIELALTKKLVGAF